MDSTERRNRCIAELESLRELAAESSILVVEMDSARPDKADLRFLGRGLARGASAHAGPSVVETHHLELRLPMSFPESPPDIRWRSPVFHPNISASGFVHLREIGIEWSEEHGLTSVVERLWDVARGAYADMTHVSNHSARNWFEKQSEVSLPVDVRPLRDKAKIPSKPSGPAKEILYIGDDTPTPTIPTRKNSTPKTSTHSASPRFSQGDDVWYIGDE